MEPTDTFNILIVDDEMIVCVTLSAMMKHFGHTTEFVNDGESGKEIMMEKQYDAAFVDMRMPGLDGMKLLEWSRKKQLRLPIIIMTGHGAKKAYDEAIKAGAFAFIYKPFSLKEIKKVVKTIQKRPPPDEA